MSSAAEQAAQVGDAWTAPAALPKTSFANRSLKPPRKAMAAEEEEATRRVAFRNVERHNAAVHQSEQSDARDRAHDGPREATEQEPIRLEPDVERPPGETLEHAQKRADRPRGRAPEPHRLIGAAGHDGRHCTAGRDDGDRAERSARDVARLSTRAPDVEVRDANGIKAAGAGRGPHVAVMWRSAVRRLDPIPTLVFEPEARDQRLVKAEQALHADAPVVGQRYSWAFSRRSLISASRARAGVVSNLNSSHQMLREGARSCP